MRRIISEKNLNWETALFIASNYITWQDKTRKRFMIERYFFKRKDGERIKKALMGRVCKLYFCLPESDSRNNVSWGEGRVSLPRELLNSLNGKVRFGERRVKIITSAIYGKQSFGVDLTIELNGRAIEFSINRKHKIRINQRIENGKKKHKTTKPWMLLEQAVKVGENIIELSN